MATSSLPQGTPSPHPDHYSIKEFQLLVRDTPVVPAEIQPFVGIQYTSSNQVYQAFQHLASMPVETFVVVHLDGKNRMVGMTTCSIGRVRQFPRPAFDWRHLPIYRMNREQQVLRLHRPLANLPPQHSQSLEILAKSRL